MVAHSFYRLPGGEDRYVEQQVPLLRTRHEVETLWRHNRDLAPGLRTAAHMTSSGPRAEVEAAISSFRPDVVHLHNAYPALGPAVHLATAKADVPLVMTVHNFRLRCPNGYMFTEGAACRRCEGGVYAHAVLHDCFGSRSQAAGYATALWVHRFVLRLERKVSLFITPSEFVRARMIEWGIDAARIEVVRNFTEIAADGSPPGGYGVFLGRLSGEKGIDVLLRALALAGDPPFRIAGDGPVEGPLVALAGELGLRNTPFLGRVPPADVPRLLRECRYLALPSLWDENAPLAALEAMAAGRPLLVTSNGGLPELVAGGEGVSCPPGDADALAGAIRSLHADEELCKEAAERARRRAEAEFTPQHHLTRLEHAYTRALARP
jgi:glycosyltransferase involved in cell wall biosynthesis